MPCHSAAKDELTGMSTSAYFARGIPMLPLLDVRASIDFWFDQLEFKMIFNSCDYIVVGRDAI